MSYRCEKCFKEFSYKSYYERHLKKKLDCSKPTCEKCGKQFNRPFGLRQHLMRKTSCVPDTVKNMMSGNIIGDHNNVHIGDKITINQKVIIRPFGCENIDFITDEMIEKIEWSESFPVLLFRMKNCDPEHPENHNVTISNIREKIGMIKTKDGWRKEDLDVIIRDIFNYQDYHIDMYFTRRYGEDRHLNLKTENIAKILNTLSDFLENDVATIDIKIMKRKLLKELINNKGIVLNSKRKYDRKDIFIK
jgi:hypothetical protein